LIYARVKTENQTGAYKTAASSMRIDHYQQQDHFFWIDLIGRPQALCRPLLHRLVLPFE
jgi:hypothetical protein